VPTPSISLRARLLQPPIVVAPGVYDALTAMLAEAAGFTVLYVSGAAISYTRLGRPDIGLVTMTEVAETVAAVRDRIEAALIVDADTGYGNALNVARTVRLLERAGAAAIQLEDQTFPKRCGHLADKSLIPASEMTGKIKAAVDARASEETLIVARTDAVAVASFDQAIDRARLYAEAGADVLFVEAPRSRDQLCRIAPALGGIKPLMANMVEGGQTPVLSARELQDLGFGLVIFPGAVVRTLAHAAQELYAVLSRDGTTDALRSRMLDFDALNGILGTSQMLEAARAYDSFEPQFPAEAR
jgi:2-methylisocitrate lyase-like PEP mutase family enzyme